MNDNTEVMEKEGEQREVERWLCFQKENCLFLTKNVACGMRFYGLNEE